MPLDSISVPDSDNLPPLRDLVTRALAKRPDLAVTKLNLESSDISALGTSNGILPNVQVAVSTSNSGLAGKANPASGLEPSPGFVGGLGTALGQIFRRDYASESGGGQIAVSIHNRVAQGDYGIDQLQLRQEQLAAHREQNELVVEISNQMVGMRQARARYSAAVDTRKLQEELLEKEQQKFKLGGSTLNDLIGAQRALADAQSAEVATLAAYSRARVALDQVLGETLEANHVSVGEALKGSVARVSTLPYTLANNIARGRCYVGSDDGDPDGTGAFGQHAHPDRHYDRGHAGGAGTRGWRSQSDRDGARTGCLAPGGCVPLRIPRAVVVLRCHGRIADAEFDSRAGVGTRSSW